MAYLWHLWPGRGWPLSEDEENELVAAWGDGREGTVRRDAIIVALGGIRCGSNPEALRKAAPGVPGEDLKASYLHMLRLLQESKSAWERCLSAESQKEFSVAAETASKLLPAPVEILRTSYRMGGRQGFEAARERVLRRCRSARDAVDDVTSRMTASDDAKAVELGRLLFDPFHSGLWGDPYFIAARVGELTPVRTRTLLGEEPDSSLVFADVNDMPQDQ